MIRPDRARLVPYAFLVIALSFAMPRASAAEVEQVRIAEAKRVGDRVFLEISTPGGTTLQPEAFHIRVNDLPAADISVSSRFDTENPPEIVLVIDTSASMAGVPLDEAKKAVDRFLATVDPKARVALIRLSSTAEVVTDFTTDRDAVKKGVASLEAAGETAVSEGIMQALELGDAKVSAERTIVVLSDGAGAVEADVFDEALVAAKRKKAMVSVVGIRSRGYAPSASNANSAGPATSARYARWGKLATNTGGALVETSDTSQLSQIFEALARSLTSGYHIELNDPDPLATSSQIEIEVENGSTLMHGSRIFRLDVPAVSTNDSRPIDFNIPAQLFLGGVFLAVSVLTYIATERLRRKKVSPADRIAWYEDPNTREIDADALINAAVLNRAKELATQLADKTGYLEKIEREIEGAGMKWRPGEAIVASLLLSVVGGLLGLVLGGWIAGLFLFVLGAMGPKLFIKQKASKRRKAFYDQLTDILALLTGGLRAGYSMQQAAGAVAEDAPPPASDEFRRVMAEVRLGASLEDSLRALAKRVDIIDFDWTVLAIEIQREVGGDLAEILETISETIRNRERLRGKVKTLTAEGRLSGVVLGALPFAMAGFITMRNPEYLSALYQTQKGLMMCGASLFMMIIGAFWMKKIVTIEV